MKDSKRTVLHSPDSMTQSRLNPGLDFRGLNIKKKGDQFIIEKGGDPNKIPPEADELLSRLEDEHMRDALGSRGMVGYDAIRTERAARPDFSIKRMLLRSKYDNTGPNVSATNTIKIPMDGGLELQLQSKDDSTLIDKLHEATFTDQVGLQWIADKYALRTTLRKAKCFTLDQATSALVADFSMAIVDDVESARRMAIPPFPVTWIDLDNRARLARVKALGIPLTKTAAGETEAGEPVERVGWLIYPAVDKGGYYAFYCAQFDTTMMISPYAYWWHTDEARPAAPSNYDNDSVNYFHQVMAFGINSSNARWEDVGISRTPVSVPSLKSDDTRDLMQEIQGELRHIFGFLIALGAGQLGIEARYTAQPKPTSAPKIAKGKTLLPLEHKVLHLHLAKRMTVAKVILRSITHHRLRWHEVRAHFRTLKNADGTVKKRVPVKSHERGDERLGRVEKSYKVER